MNHNKGLLPIVICSCVVAVIYLVIALTVPFLQTPSYWVAFSFGWLAIVVAIVANLYVVKASNTARGVLYRSSLSVISIVYLIVATIATFIFMAMGFAPIWLVIVVQVVLAAVCIAILVSTASAASHIESGEQVTQQQIAFIVNMRAQVNSYETFAFSPETKQAVNMLAEALRFTDPVSDPALYPFDQELATEINALREALLARNADQAILLCSQAKATIDRRAAIALTVKH